MMLQLYFHAFQSLVKRLCKFVFSVVKFITEIFLPVIILSSFCEVMTVPTCSMEPVMSVQDSCLVSKISWGLNIFTPLTRSFFHKKLLSLWKKNGFARKTYLPFNDLKRGSIVAFVKPRESRVTYAKNVVALPGDSVQIKDSKLYINGISAKYEILDKNYIYYDKEEKKEYKAILYTRTIENGPSHTIMYAHTNFKMKNSPIYYVPEGYVMCQGRNINMSNDSFFSLGFIPISCIIGRPIFILWSSPNMHELVKYCSPYMLLSLHINLWKIVKNLSLFFFKIKFNRSGRII